jgi:hypothetical protein
MHTWFTKHALRNLPQGASRTLAERRAQILANRGLRANCAWVVAIMVTLGRAYFQCAMSGGEVGCDDTLDNVANLRTWAVGSGKGSLRW